MNGLALHGPRRGLARSRGGGRRIASEGAVAVLVAAGLLALLTVVPQRLGISIAFPAIGVLALAAAVLNPRLEWSLYGLAFYLGCVDGPLKLVTGSSAASVLRDVLLIAVVGGVLLRLTAEHRRLPRIPYLLPIALFAAIVVAQAVNPETPSATGVLAGWRQQLEFVPLLILAAIVADRPGLLRSVGIVLLVLTVPNVIAAAIQARLTPEQFAAWGPGYAERVLGLGAFVESPRTFDAGGIDRVRPFGLGSDTGAAGIFGWMAIPFALAFALSAGRFSTRAWIGGGGFVFCILGILTSQSRGVVLVAIVAVLAFFALTARSRNAVSTAIALAGTVLVVFGFVTLFAVGSTPESLERLTTLAPGSAVSTIASNRGASLRLVPEYATRFPFGVGLGRSGPASGAVGAASGLNAENEFNFLIGEIGLIGLVVFAVLWLAVLRDAIRLARRETDPHQRLLWCAVAATLTAATVVWFQASPTTAPPTGPLFWFLAGVVGVAAARARSSGGSTEAPEQRTPTEALP